MSSPPRLFLIDGTALAYRCHFAFSARPLTNKKGMHTSAIYGFTTSLLRLIEREKPDLLAVVFDAPDKTFRHVEYPEYKATREKMPDEMADQIPYIRRVVEAMGIPFVISPGFEADDIIGTFAKKADQRGLDTYLVTGDKDFMQLLSPRVRMYQTKKDGDVEILDASAPEAKWGVPVPHVTDLLGLMGDSSDNVPGVPGVGEKTAARLIHDFGTMEALYARLEEVTPIKLRESLRTHRDQAVLSKRLVTIHIDVPKLSEPENLKLKGADSKVLHDLYSELNFESLAASLSDSGARKTDLASEKYRRVDTVTLLDNLIRSLTTCELTAIDTETTSLDPLEAEAIGLSFSMKQAEAFYVPLRGTNLPAEESLRRLRPFFEDSRRPKGGQNVKYDRAVLLNAGIRLDGVAFDTMIESYLLDPESRQHNLDAMALKFLGIKKIATSELIGKGPDQLSMIDVDLDKLTHYACEDADATLRIHRLFAPQIAHQELEPLYREIELPLISVLGDMEREGIAIDRERLADLSRQANQRLNELTAKIHELAGGPFNIHSPKQLGPILFEKLRIQDACGVKRVRKTKTGYSTDQDTLEAYQSHPIVALLLEFRNLSKLKSTYIDALPAIVHRKTGRIHTSFNQTITATGRLSSSDPNLQNIPTRNDLGREIRKAFIPGHPGWKFLSADYSQVELRILAHLSEDPVLIETFRAGGDIHRRTAAIIFGVPDEKVSSELRGRAKAINFGVIYGMGPQRLAQETGISLDEAKKFIEAYFEKYEKVKRYLDRQVEVAREKGYVTTLLGRRRAVTEILSNNPRLVSAAERIATNTPIQGSAADIIKIAMVMIHHDLAQEKYAAKMLLQVHDELLFEAPEAEIEALTKLVRHRMSTAIDCKVPLVVDIGVGDNWAEAH